MRLALIGIAAMATLPGCSAPLLYHMEAAPSSGPIRRWMVTRTDREWRRLLTPQQYDILREKGTEPAFTGAYWNLHEPGTFVCAGCGQPLFSSSAKFDSGTGWPSFWEPIARGAVVLAGDMSDGMDRTEVLCSRCGGHLGHVFDDGPRPTGLRYCIDSAALKFRPQVAHRERR